MAANVLLPLLIPLGEQIINVTQLLGEPVVEFGRQEYRVLVHENEQPGPLLQVTVQVAVQEAFVYFSISSGNDDKVFAINKYTGKINLVKPLDFETKKRYELIVAAKLGEELTEARVVVEVLDANDNKPYFENALHETQVTEEDSINLPQHVLQVKAIDADAGRYGMLTYSLYANNSAYLDLAKQYFAIVQETGMILALKSLDRDPPHGKDKWELIVQASDGENNASTIVIINVKDVNDNPPVFMEPRTQASIYENTESGMYITTVKAVDNDDITEGDNAKLTYSIEQNVIGSKSDDVIFRINNQTGDIFTSLCCLDRETTKQYELQVVATDGGGMKGTGTVLINILDRNDVSPMFAQDEWNLDVNEENEIGQIIATLPVVDPDLNNTFDFRIVKNSGFGWDLFDLNFERNLPEVQILANTRLDYENVNHRNGFKFQIEVTDKAPKNWSSNKTVGRTSVNIIVLDINDNQPYFVETFQHKIFPENTAPGTVLSTFVCKDLDGAGKIEPRYLIKGTNGTNTPLTIDSGGIIRLSSELDYEQTKDYRLVILGIDKGNPSRTASATFSMDVSDVNDNPPHLISPAIINVIEESYPTTIGQIQLADLDNETLGNGSPFTAILDPEASSRIKTLFKLTFDSKADSGRGLGQISLLNALDREESSQLPIPIVTSDSGLPKLTSTISLTVKVLDVNDNPMHPANKRIHVFTTDRVRKDIAIGRVYVTDPDDWNESHKKYSWRRPHPLFLLNETSGNLSMRPGFKSGGYYLQFSVSDPVHDQNNILANVSVSVEFVKKSLLTSATPVMLSASPEKLIKEQIGSVKQEYSLLSLLMDYIRKLMAGVKNSSRSLIDVVSVESVLFNEMIVTRIWIIYDGPMNLHHFLEFHKIEMESTIDIDILSIGTDVCGTLLRNCSSGCWSRIDVKEDSFLIEAQTNSFVGPSLNLAHGCGCSTPARSSSITGLPLAHPVLENVDPVACTEGSCLNGGQCIPVEGGHRCVCPQETTGASCKILSRQFDTFQSKIEDEGGGTRTKVKNKPSWAWVNQIPSCTDVHISMEFRTSIKDAVLLFSGELPQKRYDRYNLHKKLNARTTRPKRKLSQESISRNTMKSSTLIPNSINTTYTHDTFGSIPPKSSIYRGKIPRGVSALRHKHQNFRLHDDFKPIKTHKYRRKRNRLQRVIMNRDIFWLELRNGRPYMILDLGSGPVLLYLNVSKTLSDDRWHRIDVIWKDQLTELIVDLCSGQPVYDTMTVTGASMSPPEAKSCRVAAALPHGNSKLNTNAPLQVGGIAYEGSPTSSISSSLYGCVRNLRINNELRDLGYSLLSVNSIPGCADKMCLGNNNDCNSLSRCTGTTTSAGLHGSNCDLSTYPSTFHSGNSLHYRLSFTPFKFSTFIQFRIRSRSRNGHILSLLTKESKGYISFSIFKGKLCLFFKLPSNPESSVCLNKLTVNDGAWHTIRGLRVGYILFLEMDGGDINQYNSSMVLNFRGNFDVSKDNGLIIGGVPENHAHNLLQMQKSFDGCLDGVRLQNLHLPLEISSSNSSWAQIISSRHVTHGCSSISACANITCHKPTSCIDDWRSYHCGCEEGRELNQDGDICIDVNECEWSPCLNNGFCTNLQPGYVCTCTSGFGGKNCEIYSTIKAKGTWSLTSLFLISSVCILVVFLGILALIFKRRRKVKLEKNKSLAGRLNTDPGPSEASVFHLTNGDQITYAPEGPFPLDQGFMELKDYGPDDASIPNTLPVDMDDVDLFSSATKFHSMPQSCMAKNDQYSLYLQDSGSMCHSSKDCCSKAECHRANIDINYQL